jgi:Xaa-Pro aminopeptidase
LRLIKSNKEIAIIKKACRISADAHINLMRKCKPNISEKKIESQLLYDFGSNNATEAYTSIVAGGKNACILHYIDNSSNLKNGDLLLTDAACEFEYYASDITRTIPVNGKFTQDQKLIYSLVLKAQKNAISKCIIGNTLQDVHKAAVRTLTKGLIDLGLLRGDYKSIVKNELYKKFYMHNTGHWMGLDVHDPLEYVCDGKPIKLKPGMIFTVEPGLYIRADKDVNKRFHNIGIRIEDDILITKNGPDVLTSRAPKEIRDIENTMNNIK